MKTIELTLTTDNPENIQKMFALKAASAEVQSSDPTPDTLTLQFACDDESHAPVMRYKINDGDEIQSMKIKNLAFSLPTTFFPMPKSIACMIGNQAFTISSPSTKTARRAVVACFGERGLSVPPEIYEKALSEAITFERATESIRLHRDYTTSHVATALGIDPQSVRYHLRNLLSEGADIGAGNRWETDEEFQRICNLIKPRIGAHGRRA